MKDREFGKLISNNAKPVFTNFEVTSYVKYFFYILFFKKWKESCNSKSRFIVRSHKDQIRWNVGVFQTAVKWMQNLFQKKIIYGHAQYQFRQVSLKTTWYQ
jgi:hypothetical protein